MHCLGCFEDIWNSWTLLIVSDRSCRRSNRQNGSTDEFQARCHADRSREIQVSREGIFARSSCKGKFTAFSKLSLTRKIDKYSMYYTLAPQSNLLSESEQQYLAAHQGLLKSHYDASFMSQFPENLQAMDDAAGGINMVDEPDAETAVFVRVLRDVDREVYAPGMEAGLILKRGDVMVIAWGAIKDLRATGDVELL
jgi:DNA replication complex GINS protein SLD5 C-terminus